MKKIKKYICGEFGFDIEVEIKSEEELKRKIIEKLMETPAKDMGLLNVKISN